VGGVRPLVEMVDALMDAAAVSRVGRGPFARVPDTNAPANNIRN